MCGTAVAGVCRVRGWLSVAAIWFTSFGGTLPFIIRHSISFEVAKVALYSEVEGCTWVHNESSYDDEMAVGEHCGVYCSHAVPCYESVAWSGDDESCTVNASVGGTFECAKRSYVSSV